MANTMLIQAITNKGKRSKPFTINYNADKPTGRFVLKLEDGYNSNGNPITTVGNLNLRVIRSHQQDWLNNLLTGYRYRNDGAAFIIAEAAQEPLPSVNNIFNSEAF